MMAGEQGEVRRSSDMYMYSLMVLVSPSLLNTAAQHRTARECLRNCLNRNTEDGLSLPLHRRLLQTHPDLRLTQNVADSSCLACRPMCWIAFSLTASDCFVYAGQHMTACLQQSLGICETNYDVRHLVCCINHHRPLPLNTATLLPVVYRIWLKNIATMVDVDSLQSADRPSVGILRRRRRPTRSALLA